MKKVLSLFFLLCALVFFVSGCSTEPKKLSVDNVVGIQADTASQTLKDKGFEEVTTLADESSDSSMVLKASNWTVIRQEPAADSEVTPDTKITLYCKKTTEYSTDKLEIAKNNLGVIGQTVPEAQSKMQELGYSPTYFHQQGDIDYTDVLRSYPEDELTRWVVTDIKSVDENKKEVQLSVNTAENVANREAAAAAKAALESKLDPSYAWQAVEKYGDIEYPYGFKLHWIMGKLAQEPKDENTWFLKATVTVKNQYGAELDGVCEAYVSGTTDNPQVTGFTVY